jgi:anti-sigma B factor antagonist
MDVCIDGARGTAVVTLNGDVDLACVGKLRDLLLVATQGAEHLVVVDASAATFVDTTAIGVLIAAHRRMYDKKGSLRVVNATVALRRVLRLLGADYLLDGAGA